MILQQQLTRRVFALFAVLALVIAALAPLVLLNSANAAELDQRYTVIDKAYVDATDVEYVFNFQIPTGGDTAVQGIKIQWCDTARQETCVIPAGTGFTVASATVDAQSFPDAATSDTAFVDTAVGDSGECQETTNAAFEMCLTRTDTDIVDVATNLTLTISGVTHSDTEGSIYPHMYLYDNSTFTDTGDAGGTDGAAHFGITAVAVVDQITVSATVAEYLEFCVGTQDADLTDDNTLDNSATETCADFTDTSLNIGTVNFSEVCYTDDTEAPAGEVLCENADYRKAGYAMVSTNASDGVTISYIAEDDTVGTPAGNLGALRVPGSDCTVGPADENACFLSAGTTAVNITPGVETFGMTVADVVQNGDPGYNGAVGTANITRDAEYDGLGKDGAANVDCTGGVDESCWAWDETNPDVIASSSGVVDKEHLIMNFAAAASLKTPTGTYSVTSTYVATPQF